MIIGIAGGVPQTTGINTIIYSAPTLPSSAGFDLAVPALPAMVTANARTPCAGQGLS
jgi:hypothetical protein